MDFQITTCCLEAYRYLYLNIKWYRKIKHKRSVKKPKYVSSGLYREGATGSCPPLSLPPADGSESCPPPKMILAATLKAKKVLIFENINLWDKKTTSWKFFFPCFVQNIYTLSSCPALIFGGNGSKPRACSTI